MLIKRGPAATIDELLAAAGYVLAHGNMNVTVCERGIRTFERSSRDTLDISAVPVLKERTDLPVIVDSSHAAGRRELVRPLSLTALLIVGGVANALGGPSVSLMLKREVAVHRQGLAFGAQNSGATLGALLAGLALPAVAIPFGWRWAFVLVAGLALAAAALAPAGSPFAVAPRVIRPRGLTVVHALAVAAALASAAGVGFVSFLVLYAVESGMSQAAAGLLLVAVSLAATVSRIGVGVLADRRGQEPLRPVAAMLTVSIAGYVLLIAGEPALIVVAALVAGSFGWAWPGGLTLAVVQRAPGAPAWAVGVLMAGLFSGAIAGPLLVGVLAEAQQFALAWSACAGFALLAACTVVLAALR